MCDVHGWLEFESSGAAEERRQDWGEASVRAVGGDEFGHLSGEAGAGIFGDDTALLVDEPHRLLRMPNFTPKSFCQGHCYS